MRRKWIFLRRLCALALALGVLCGQPAGWAGVLAMENPPVSTGESAEPDPTPAPQPTEQPQPTEEPQPTEDPQPTEEPRPTEQPEQTREPMPTPVPTSAPTPSARPAPTASPKPEQSATPEQADPQKDEQAIPSNHLDVQAASSFYMLVNADYYYVAMDLRTPTATIYEATRAQAESMSGEYGALRERATAVSVTVDISQNRAGADTLLYRGYSMTDSSGWQQNGSRGMEYRFTGREDGNNYTFFKDAVYTVTLHIACDFAALPLAVSYASSVEYGGANNVCPGTGGSRGIDLTVSGHELSHFFTKGSLTLRKLVPDAPEETPLFSFTVYGPETEPRYWSVDETGKAADCGAEPVRVRVAANSTLSLNDLPVGNYCITEVDIPAGYTPRGDTAQARVEKTAGNNAEAVFTNLYSGGLVLSKTVDGVADPDKTFTFLLYEGTRAAGTPVARYRVSGGSPFGAALKAGTYTLAEADAPEYEAVYTLQGRSATGSLTFESDGASRVEVRVDNRTRTVLPRVSLTVRERVEGTSKNDVPFHVKVTLSTEEDYPCILYDREDHELQTGSVHSGQQLDLCAGQWAMIRQLEPGTQYALTEVDEPSGYHFTGSRNSTGVLEEDTDAELVNLYEAKASLTLTGHKELLAGDGTRLAAGQFTFLSTRLKQQDVQTAQNKADGSFEFVFHYTQKDVGCRYTYLITEQQQTDALDYDPAVYQLDVAVEDNNDGTLTVEKALTREGEPAELPLFTNGYQTVQLTAHKVWEDTGHSGHRPKQLCYTLTAASGGQSRVVERVTVTAKNWDYTWSGLPRYDAAHNEIAYTVAESDPGSRYTCTVQPGARTYCYRRGLPVGWQQTLTLTNRYHEPDSDDDDDDEEETPTPAPTAAPAAPGAAWAAQLRSAGLRVQTGDDSPTRLAVSAALFGAAAVALAVIHRRKH